LLPQQAQQQRIVNMNPQPTVIVLAAGQGSRFAGDGHKLAQPILDSSPQALDDRESLLATTLHHAIESRLPVVVVTTAALAPIAYEQIAARDVVVIPAAAPIRGRGMGDSIAAGVAVRPDASGWLILPADMPRVRASTIQAVADALQQHAVAYAQYQGRRGHPVGFAAELYSELAALTGDEGARRLVARYPAQAVEVDDPGVLIDIDTVEDLAALRAAAGGVSTAAPFPR
jgi:molybdenum cofactor cytidylyltransferase